MSISSTINTITFKILSIHYFHLINWSADWDFESSEDPSETESSILCVSCEWALYEFLFIFVFTLNLTSSISLPMLRERLVFLTLTYYTFTLHHLGLPRISNEHHILCAISAFFNVSCTWPKHMLPTTMIVIEFF